MSLSEDEMSFEPIVIIIFIIAELVLYEQPGYNKVIMYFDRTHHPKQSLVRET